MKKSLLALAVSLAAVSGANAAWDNGVDIGNTSNFIDGEALLMIVDDVRQVSYAQDLGVHWSALLSGAAFNGQSFAINTTAYNQVFGASAVGNISWNVVAYNSSEADYNTYGLIGGTDLAVDDISAFDPGALFNSTSNTHLTAANVPSGLSDFVSASNPESANNLSIETATNGAKYVGGLFQAMNPSGLNGALISGTSLTLVKQGFVDNGGFSNNTALGTATLAGDTLTLGSAAPVVPVPAAAWLFGSALVGLTGIARRRAK
jgi:hypothetical protein